jgi:anti-anti-sigma factor
MNREFLIDPRADATHILLTGEFDLAALPAFHLALNAHPVRVVVNLDGVTFVDSSGLGGLVAGYHTATAIGIGYRIGPAATPAVARVLTVTGLGEALVADPAEDADTGIAG